MKAPYAVEMTLDLVRASLIFSIGRNDAFERAFRAAFPVGVCMGCAAESYTEEKCTHSITGFLLLWMCCAWT